MKLDNVKINCRNEDGTLNTEMNKAFRIKCRNEGVVIDSTVNYLKYPSLIVIRGTLYVSQMKQCFDNSPEQEVTIINGELSYVGAVPKPEVNDAVHQPKHYELMEGVESIEIIAASLTPAEWRGFCLGNAIKYRLRAGKKDALQQDIDKAVNYTDNLYTDHKHLNRKER